MKARQLTKEWFISKTKMNANGCMEWQMFKGPKGYGVVGLSGSRKTERTHRTSYRLFKGDPTGMHVLHTCDNPSCVNPDHLWLGTNADNVADKMSKGRQSSVVHELNPRSKLSYDDVHEIRTAFTLGARQQILADLYGLTDAHVSQIVLGKKWVSV